MQIDLQNPVEIDGEVVSSLSIRPPTEADFSAIYRINARAEVKATKLLSRLTGLDWRALTKIEEANEGLFAKIDGLILTPSAGS